MKAKTSSVIIKACAVKCLLVVSNAVSLFLFDVVVVAVFFLAASDCETP